MGELFKLLRVASGFALALTILFQVGCTTNAGPKKEIEITTKSDEARELFMEGRQMFENIRFDEARDLFSQSLEKDADFALAHLFRAISSATTMEFQNHLQKAVELKANASEGEQLMIDAVKANANNDPVKSIEIWQQLTEKFPDDKRASYFLGASYMGQNKDDKAIAEFNKVIELDKDYAPVYNLLGYAYRENRDYEKSEEAFKKYISLLPDEANPHDSLADLYTKMGRHEDAITHYKKAVELNPKFALSQRKIGTNLVFMGKYDEGREAFQKAIDMEPTATGKLNDLAMISSSYLYEGKLQEAQDAGEGILAMAQEENIPEWEAGYHAARCDIYVEMGDLDKAMESVAECRKVVMASDLMESVKDNFEKGALFDEAVISAKRDDFESAMAKADEHKAKIEAGNDPTEMKDHHALLGLIYFEKGDHAKAIEHFEQADHENPYTVYHLALAQSESGNKEKANELFQKVADWNQHSLNYALVRPKAMMAVSEEMTAK